MVFELGMLVDLCMAYMFKHVLMTLTLMQGHNGSAEDKIQRCIISTCKQVIRIKLATTVSHVLHDLDWHFENSIWLDHLVFLAASTPHSRAAASVTVCACNES